MIKKELNKLLCLFFVEKIGHPERYSKKIVKYLHSFLKKNNLKII
jgi:hypothetical protein